MSKQIWLLNFEHDLALASGNRHYIPPKVAVSMNEDMSPLPLWLTGNATVLTKQLTLSAATSAATQKVMEDLGIAGRLVPSALFEPEGGESYNVWGWDPQSAQQLEKAGHHCAQDLEHIRQWSHRGKTIGFLQDFANKGLFPSEMIPRKATTEQEIEEWTTQKQYVMKAPLSGSGRGIWWALNGYDFNVQRWSRRTLADQQCILCEPIWEKTGDFAMEFDCKAGEAHFAGYSQFIADNAGVYRCNTLRNDSKIEQTLAEKVGADKVLATKQLWKEMLEQTIARKYNGIVGIDMLTGICNGRETLNPCVEINLRMTMGMAARLVYDHWIHPEREGEYRTIHFKNDGELARHAEEMRAQHPTVIKNGKIESGYVLLTAETKQSRYGIEVEVF